MSKTMEGSANEFNNLYNSIIKRDAELWAEVEEIEKRIGKTLLKHISYLAESDMHGDPTPDGIIRAYKIYNMGVSRGIHFEKWRQEKSQKSE